MNQPTENQITFILGGSREGNDYKFVCDKETLRQLASKILRRLDGLEPGPWETDPSIILCEEISDRNKTAFLTFQIKP